MQMSHPDVNVYKVTLISQTELEYSWSNGEGTEFIFSLL